jgi:L-galactose dehydrogenase/L-glyceraldehyde 3-phosphate reductase
MRKVYFGRTGLEVSELALGGGVTGGVLIKPDDATRFNAMRRAVAGGINWIDTAPSYGDGESEETIGRHLRSLTPQPHVSTKVRLEADDLDDITGAIERSLEQSLQRLRCDWVALLLLHNHLGRGVGERLALSLEQVLDRGGVADAFDRLKEQGLVQACGITVAGDTAACLEVINSGRFDAAQVYYNAINPTAAWRRAPPGWCGGQDFTGVLTACFHQHMGVMNIRVWAGGLLASAQRPERLSLMTSDTDLDNELLCAEAVREALGREHGSPAQAALRFVLGNRDLATHVVGVSRVEELNEALEAAARGPLPSAAVSGLEALWANEFSHGPG